MSLSLNKYRVQTKLLDLVYIAGSMDYNEEEKLDYQYYLAYLLSSIYNLEDFWSSFPRYSHEIINEVLDKPDDCNVTDNTVLHKEAERRYPDGARILRECVFSRLLD